MYLPCKVTALKHTKIYKKVNFLSLYLFIYINILREIIMLTMNITDGGFYTSSVQNSLINPYKRLETDDIEIDFSQSTQDENEEDDDINVIAHRGYSSAAPENTIPAIIAAAEHGYKTVECDIEWTKDSVPVLLHDSTINRTARKANGKKLFFKKKCSSLTYEQLLSYDFGSWKDKKYKGTKIPTFEELLNCSKEYDLNVYVELKESSKFNKEKAQILVDAVKEAGMEDKITWISFEDDYLQEIKNLMPDARLGYLSKKKPSSETINTLKSLKTDENEVFLDVKASKMTNSTSEMLKNSGFDFETWTVNDCGELNNLFSLDCKGITTDTITEDHFEKHLDEYKESHTSK